MAHGVNLRVSGVQRALEIKPPNFTGYLTNIDTGFLSHSREQCHTAAARIPASPAMLLRPDLRGPNAYRYGESPVASTGLQQLTSELTTNHPHGRDRTPLSVINRN